MALVVEEDVSIYRLLNECKRQLRSVDEPTDEIAQCPRILQLLKELAALVAPELPPLKGAAPLSSGGVESKPPSRSESGRTDDDGSHPDHHTKSAGSSTGSIPAGAKAKGEGTKSDAHHHLEPNIDERRVVTAECCGCGLDGYRGTFVRRGFKCERCMGSEMWYFRDDATCERTKPEHDAAGDHELEVCHRRALVLAPPYGQNPQFVPSVRYSGTNKFVDCISPVQNVSAIDAIDETRRGKYLVSYSKPASRAATSSQLAVLRSLVHPNLLYLFACGEDKKREQFYFVHEFAFDIESVIHDALVSEGSETEFATSSNTATPAFGSSFTSEGLPQVDDDVCLSPKLPSLPDPVVNASPSVRRKRTISSLLGPSSPIMASNVSSPGGLVDTMQGTATPAPVSVTASHLEWIRKIAYSALQALEALHQLGLVHGACTPRSLFVDENGTVKLRFVPEQCLLESEWAQFSTPEWETIQRSDVQPTPATDVYQLGATISSFLLRHLTDPSSLFELAGGLLGDSSFTTSTSADFVGGSFNQTSSMFVAPSESMSLHSQLSAAHSFVATSPTPDGSRSGDLVHFMKFLLTLMAKDPSQRPNPTAALLNDVFTSVRVVNGAPADTVTATVQYFEWKVDSGNSSPDRVDAEGNRQHSPVESHPDGFPQPPRIGSLLRKKSVSWRHMPDEAESLPAAKVPMVPAHGPLLYVHRGDDAAATSSPGTDVTAAKRGQFELRQFMKDQGPLFQVVRPSRASLTLYSVRFDPRRRRSNSVNSQASTPFPAKNGKD